MEGQNSSKDDDYFRNSSIKPSTETEINVQFENLLLNGNNSYETSYIPFPTNNYFSKNDFEVIELLGKGAYAKVVKALCTKNKEIKAIKIIDKCFIEKVNFYFN
jgi:hypothetical protein